MTSLCRNCGVGEYLGRALRVNPELQWCSGCWGDLPPLAVLVGAVRDGRNGKRYRDRRLNIVATLNGSVSLTPLEWARILIASEGLCSYCKAFVGLRRLTMDHVVPVSKGGEHVKDNVAAACRRCNESKGNRTPDEWTESRTPI